ncbi:glycosyltransferase family 4 protein [Candidatus Falkowbacteria bacterium]|nr:glycosyltransferase family 4 protein [Candidatus Falkowbacteria bacterium]
MKKKILHIITQSELGGAQRYILDIARNLKNEYDVVVAFGEQGSKGELAAHLEKTGIPFFVIHRLKRNISPLNDILAYFAIKRLIREIKPHVVHLNSSKISILGSLAVKNCINKSYSPLVVYTVHGWVFNEPMGSLKRRIYFELEKRTAKYKDKIICINKMDLHQAEKDLKISKKKLSLIYHGLDTSQYKTLSKKEARAKLFAAIRNAKIPDEKTIIIGSIGNLYRTKGYYYLIKAMHYLVIDYGFPVTAIIIGEGPERSDLEARIIKFHPMDYNAMDGEVGNKIILAGRIDNAAELLPAFDIYACTSLKEGFPYTILEAMNAALPIVATRVGGIPDMISDNINGFLVEPHDSKTLAAKMAEIIGDTQTRNRLSAQAQYDTSHLFKFSKMLEQTKKIYKG